MGALRRSLTVLLLVWLVAASVGVVYLLTQHRSDDRQLAALRSTIAAQQNAAASLELPASAADLASLTSDVIALRAELGAWERKPQPIQTDTVLKPYVDNQLYQIHNDISALQRSVDQAGQQAAAVCAIVQRAGLVAYFNHC